MKENLSRNSLLYFAILALGFVLFIMLFPQASGSFFPPEVECLEKIYLEETVKFPSSEPSQLMISSWNLVLTWLQMNQALLESELPDR